MRQFPSLLLDNRLQMLFLAIGGSNDDRQQQHDLIRLLVK